MATGYYKTTCPHCGTKNAGFTSHAQREMATRSGAEFNVFMTCNACAGAIIVKVSDPTRGVGPMAYQKDTNMSDASQFFVRDVYPKSVEPAAPADTPAAIAKSYVEAEDNHLAKRFETCAMLCRKAMDLATKTLRGDVAKSENLYQRIEELKKIGLITNDMAAWAHAVRLNGNDSVHGDDEISEAEAKDLLNFTQTFLLYAFTLPAMVGRRQTGATG